MITCQWLVSKVCQWLVVKCHDHLSMTSSKVYAAPIKCHLEVLALGCPSVQDQFKEIRRAGLWLVRAWFNKCRVSNEY